MKTDNGRSTSVWMEIPDDMTRPPLAADTDADVCIVGAGIAGMSVAYELAKAGKKVIVLDDGPIAGGETCRTTAHLVNALDDRYMHLEFLFGQEGSKLAAESHTRAIGRAEEIAKAESPESAFERVPGYLFARADMGRDYLRREWDAGLRAGLDLELLEKTPLPAHGDTPCLRFPDQGIFHPTLYLRDLAKAIERMGGKIHTGSHANEMVGGKDAHVKTANGKTVKASHVVVATNSPVNDRYAIHTKQAPYRTFVIAAKVPKGSVENALFWDVGHPYHYVRLLSGSTEDLIISGGEDHITAHEDDAPLRYGRLEEWTRARFPTMREVTHRWSGQVYEPIDYMGFIGRNPGDDDNVYIATGDSGNGITHGIIAGMLISDLILGKKNPWEELYEPSRKNPKAAGRFIENGIDVTKSYCEVFTGGDVESADSIKNDSGTVIRKGIKKIALYRDEGGKLHSLSAVCPHLGCIVHWNSEEKTWDCPCHGSRFQKTGEVVNGPALSGMTKESLDAA